MPDKSALIKALETTFRQQQDFIAQLPEAERTEVGKPDRWSAKDMLVHTVVWSDRRLDDLEVLARGETAAAYEDYNHENQAIFETYRDTSWDEVDLMAEAVHTRTVAYIQASSEEALLSAEGSPAENIPLWRALVGNRILHVLVHLVEHHISRERPAQARQLADQLYGAVLNLDNSPAWRGTLVYNWACVDALTGQPDSAIERLGEALRLNPELTEWSKQDSDLDSLRDRADYQALYE
ncbi:MAG: ClbS/DfsB family four-helix bundle protein [Anaerolineae bacterium]|nr:ClbS/DfsB family four-helix bundle protein [Anaerolineae bacterium]